MKKRGFTLAELLITLAIIGVAAALIIPLIGRITPDKYKPRVMKYYSEVAKATDEMLSDTGIYYAERDNNGKTTCFGLACQGTPGVPPYNSSDYSGGVKYKNLLFSYLGIKDGEYKDGSSWSVESDGDDGYVITVDADGGSKGKGCTYNPESCKKPDIFKFKVDKYGKVTPDDSMSRAYFENSENANNRKKDEECAKELYNGAESCSGNDIAGKGDFKDEEAGDGDEEPTCDDTK